jgi:hypothetical protein
MSFQTNFASTSQDVSLPPELVLHLGNPAFVDELVPLKAPSSSDSHSPAKKSAFITALDRHQEGVSNRRYTAKGGHAYQSTLSGLVDAYYQLPSCLSECQIHKYLDGAWAEDPEATLKLIFHFRSIPDGKAEREGFYFAFGWLYMHHPRTAILSLPHLVSQVCTRPPVKTSEGTTKERPALTHGYYKDLLNIVCLVLEGNLSTDSAHDLRDDKKLDFLHTPREPPVWQKEKYSEARKGWPSVLETTAPNDERAKLAKQRRDRRRKEIHRNLVRLLRDDNKFRALYIAVARIFAEALKEDLEVLRKFRAPGLTADERGDLKRKLTALPTIFSPTWLPRSLSCFSATVPILTTPVPPS